MGERRRTMLAMAASVAALAAVLGAAAPADKPGGAPAALRPDQVDLLIKTLKGAPGEGLPAQSFPTDGLDAARTGDAAAQGKLKAEIVAYARAEHGLRIPLSQFDKSWGMKPAPYDAAKDYAAALSKDQLGQWVADLPPPFARYRALRSSLATYNSLAATNPWKPVPSGADLTIGATGERVKALRIRMAYEDPPLAQTPPETAFDAGLADSVKRFQARHGLNPTGVVSTATIAALNVTPAERARQITANLERWRWVPRDLAPTRIEVNAPAAFLQTYQDNKPGLNMLAIAGKPVPDDHTPMLHATITSVVLNPAWHVPASIAKDLFAKERKDHGYFAREHLSPQPGNKIAPLIQAPGPKNSLGQIKFDFDNPFGVFLHDTPGQAAFTHAARDVSHGCVRLEKPADLAALLLVPNGGWPKDRIEGIIAGDDTQRVPLKQTEPLYIFYFTAYQEGAQTSFRADPYGWDAKLLGLLDAGASGSV